MIAKYRMPIATPISNDDFDKLLSNDTIYILMPVKISKIIKEEDTDNPDIIRRGIISNINNQMEFVYQKI